ncbi:histone-like nucleoid-structuring protein, MvaT/MvaU family (plasmid) [Stutzerimonas frequens]|uniref:histone-like nucleoid-structuring protein, MvaT/MvaU family n=1 Tax=Stutzerimonas frequens TaxID=2968969 RepID=UPI002DBD8C34|nr:histone-like nucleoid-structuring protein, MvaT/MvaU family [Stutzerimonas frequens]WRW29461.1 histone-like nucleoid-structuring protein, MvaT/MvaU family [Stutzerimonas frequens]
MSKLAHYRETQQLMAKLKAELERLDADTQIKRELEFESKLNALLEEYGLTPAQALAIMSPTEQVKREPKRRGERPVLFYKNPHSGEELRTKAGNNSVLKAWKAQYGADTVNSWKQA